MDETGPGGGNDAMPFVRSEDSPQQNPLFDLVNMSEMWRDTFNDQNQAKGRSLEGSIHV